MLDAKPVKIFVRDYNHICFIFNELLPIPVVVDVLIRYHVADKWEIYCPPLRYSAGITSHLPWGQSPNSPGFAHLFAHLVVRPAPPTGSFRSACSGELIRGFGKNGGGSYAGRRRRGGDGFWGRRERIEMGYRSGVAGDAGIGVGVSASCAAVLKVNVHAGNRVAVLVGDEHGEGLRQLRSGRSGLIIAAGDRDLGSGSRNRVLDKCGVLETGGTGGDRHRRDGGGQPQRRRRQAIRVGDHGRRIGNGSVVGGEVEVDSGDAVPIGIFRLRDDSVGEIGTGGAGLFRSAPGDDPRGGARRGAGGGGDTAEAGPGDRQGVGARFLGNGIDGGGVAIGVGDTGGGIEEAALAPVTEVNGGADFGLPVIWVGRIDLDRSGQRSGNGSRLGVASGNGDDVKQ